MKIDDTGSKPAPLPNLSTGGVASTRSSLRAGDSVVAPQTDKVSLSGTHHALSALQPAPIDTAKVDRLRAAIADGSFAADASQIADGLIASSRALAQSRG